MADKHEAFCNGGASHKFLVEEPFFFLLLLLVCKPSRKKGPGENRRVTAELGTRDIGETD